MRIEITIEGQEPVVFKLAQSQTVFGSAPDCDLVVEAQGVAPHHLSVQMEGDQFFVMDLGSESGSFMNDAQLMPGQRAEFTSFFPIHLGPVVTLALLSDEEEVPTFDFAQDLPKEPVAKKEEEKQEPIVPETNKKSPSRTIETSLNVRRSPSMPRSRRTEAPNKKVRAPDEGAQTKTVQLLAFLVAFGGAGVFYFTKGISDSIDPSMAPQQVAAPAAQEPVAPVVELKDVTIKFSRLAGFEAASSAVTAQKCFTPEETPLCEGLRLPVTNFNLSGVTVGEASIAIVLPAFTKAELLAHFQGINWSDQMKDLVPEVLDPRDLAALALLMAPENTWEKVGQKSWLYIAQVDSNGNSVGKVWVANFKAAHDLLTNKVIAAELRQRLELSGVPGLTLLAGLFRSVEF
jgi:hypothetical protein